MENFATTVLLLTALALPVVLFLLFRPRSRLSTVVAALVGIAAGWSFNVACVFAMEAMAVKGPSEANASNLAIALNYGWLCPLVLVLITGLAWRFATRRVSHDHSLKPNGRSA